MRDGKDKIPSELQEYDALLDNFLEREERTKDIKSKQGSDNEEVITFI